MKFERVFENENFVVILKPHGFLSTPARDPADPRPCVGRELQAEIGAQIYPVHRLDFEVSGLLMFARTPAAHKHAQKWFEEGAVQKTYQAFSLAGGQVEAFRDVQSWNSKIAKGKRRAFEAAHGKPSRTLARVIESGVQTLSAAEAGSRNIMFWRWELTPRTGRPHQLRFEMAKHAFPILGDVLYGGVNIREGWIALRATALDFSTIPPGDRLGLPARLEATPLSF